MAIKYLKNSLVDSTDIVKGVVTLLPPTIKIKSQTTSGAQTTIKCCNIYYSQPTYTVTIGGNPYKIISITAWDTMVVESVGTSQPIIVDNFLLYPAYFFHGTPRALNAEKGPSNNVFTKTPMIFMVENFKDKIFTDPSSNKERQITADIFAISHPIDPAQTTDSAYLNVVKPMRSLMECFINQLKKMIATFDMRNVEIEIENFYRLGFYVSGKGEDKSFNLDNLAGCRWQMKELTVWESGIPNCLCWMT